jgi:hypothetical protein
MASGPIRSMGSRAEAIFLGIYFGVGLAAR